MTVMTPKPARLRTDVPAAHAYTIPVVRELPRPITPLASGTW